MMTGLSHRPHAPSGTPPHLQHIITGVPLALTRLMHGLTLLPLVHLLVGMPVWCLLIAGSLLYFVGLISLLLSFVIPIDMLQGLAMTYTVLGKSLTGSTLYSGWPLPIMSLIPIAYGLSLLWLKRHYQHATLSTWITYDIDTLWRAAWLSLLALALGIAITDSLDNAMWLSGLITSGYLLVRIARFYLPWRVFLQRRLMTPDHSNQAVGEDKGNSGSGPRT